MQFVGYEAFFSRVKERPDYKVRGEIGHQDVGPHVASRNIPAHKDFLNWPTKGEAPSPLEGQGQDQPDEADLDQIDRTVIFNVTKQGLREDEDVDDSGRHADLMSR